MRPESLQNRYSIFELYVAGHRHAWRGFPARASYRTVMSVATPTVLPRPPLFPTLMPRPQQQPFPTPLAVPGRHMGRLSLRRDFVQEMEDLSEEEAELEDSVRYLSPLPCLDQHMA